MREASQPLGLILGQNYVRLEDVALNDLFFFKNLFYQKECKYAMNTGLAQIRVDEMPFF